jgi:hypothetical protein
MCYVSFPKGNSFRQAGDAHQLRIREWIYEAENLAAGAFEVLSF